MTHFISCCVGCYSRCEFDIRLNDHEATEIKTDSKFDEFSSAFSDPNLGDPASPVVIQRTSQHEFNPFGSTFCYGIRQLVVEVMENGHIAALTIYDDKM
ncbi:unnamed protein product [Caenorhabditis auriculariae]|uniref:Uncharacterized protein n=1 Tax=Caenorhabditis auriculariae TaxID=2777116 RepID=A0A8S1GYG7_9PELO|nr:unnamed protein product [Caenorhabditis auriculariae]